MGASSAYLTAVVAGAMTAGIGAANVLVAPPDVAEPAQSTARDVDRAAYVQIPIIDIGPTPGPLSIWRQLAIEAGTNPLLLGIIRQGGNSYNLPGLNTLVKFTAHPSVVAKRGDDFVDFGYISDRTETGGWSLLGGQLAGGSSGITDHRDVHFVPLLGGSRGIGFGLNGVLGETTYDRKISLLNSNLISRETAPSPSSMARRRYSRSMGSRQLVAAPLSTPIPIQPSNWARSPAVRAATAGSAATGASAWAPRRGIRAAAAGSRSWKSPLQ